MSRRLRLMFGALAAFLGCVAALCWVANPYAAWRADPLAYVPEAHTAPGNEADERITTAYRIRLVQPRILLLGSSRVLMGIPVDERQHPHVANAALSGATLDEIGALLQLAESNPHLRQVVWGIDFYAFTQQMEGFRHHSIRSRLASDAMAAVQRVRETLLSSEAIGYSRQALANAWNGVEMRPPPVPAPWPEEVLRDTLRYARADGLIGTSDTMLIQQLPMMDWLYRDYRPSARQLTLAGSIATRARARGLELLVFTPAMHACELEILRSAGLWPRFQQWKREILAAIGPYRDFTGYHEVARDESLFTDVYHYKSAVGHAILRTVLGAPCAGCGETAQAIANAGAWVDADTIDAHLVRLDELMRAADQHPSRCRAVLAGMTRAVPL